MSQATELIAQQMAKAANVKKVWGTIIFNVKDLIYAGGAVGNGTTDDTGAVQAAINEAVSKNATLVFFPPGTYKVTALTNTSTINFVGDSATFVGYAGTILQFGVSTLNAKNTITPVFNVKGYGATGDGTIDDTAAINSAIAALIAAGGGELYFPKGTYKITAALTPITVTAEIEGVGATSSIIQTTVDGINVFTINANFCNIRGLEVAYIGTTPTSGSGILLFDKDHTTVEKCDIHGFYINIDTLNGAYWTISDNLLYDPVKYNVRVQNITDTDEGDSQIIGNRLFAAGRPTIDAHIYQSSSGGLRIYGNKIMYGKVGIDCAPADGVVTSILLINTNSIENQSDAFVRVRRANTTGSLEYVSLVGNEMRSDTIAAGIIFDDGTGRAAISGGNIMHGNPTSGKAIQLKNGARDVAISGNTFHLWETALELNYNTGNNSRVTIGPNQYSDSITYNYKNIGYIQDTAIECDHNYTNNVNATDNVTYKNVYQIDLHDYSAGVMDVEVFGIVSGAGSYGRKITKLINREGAGCTVTAVTDIASGVAIDVNFDVTTTVGSVIVQVRKGGATGTSLAGTVAISVRGDVTGFKAFNTV